VTVAPTREELQADFSEADEQVRQAIAGLGEQDMVRPAIEVWSVKDHLIHMTVWHEFRFHEISRISRGGFPAHPPLSDEQVNTLNSLLVDWRRQLPTSQVLSDLDSARSLVIQAISNAPDQALREENYGEVGLRGGAAHDREHAETIAAWRRNEGL